MFKHVYFEYIFLFLSRIKFADNWKSMLLAREMYFNLLKFNVILSIMHTLSVGQNGKQATWLDYFPHCKSAALA